MSDKFKKTLMKSYYSITEENILEFCENNKCSVNICERIFNKNVFYKDKRNKKYLIKFLKRVKNKR
jgi:hypothetical protein